MSCDPNMDQPLRFVSKKERQQRNAKMSEKEKGEENSRREQEERKRKNFLLHKSRVDEPRRFSIEKNIDNTKELQARNLERKVNPRDAKRPVPLSNEKKRRFKFEWDPSEDTSQEKALFDDIPTFRFTSKQIRPGGFDILEEEKSEESSHVHWSEKPLEQMTQQDWRIFREDYRIVCKNLDASSPLRNWRDANLPPEVHHVLMKVGYKEPTPIQRQGIPIAIAHRDLLGIAQTGSGKTAAFVIPMIVNIASLPRIDSHTASRGPYGLILAPTRELAQQIQAEMIQFAEPLGIRAHTVIGGQSYEAQQIHFRHGFEIVVATPGRLMAALQMRHIVLGQCCFVVLDEADKMIDMGFADSVDEIMNYIPRNSIFEKRQCSLFSATMPEKIQKLVARYLVNPVTVLIENEDDSFSNVIDQKVFFLKEGKKHSELLNVLHNELTPILVFVNHRTTCDTLGNLLYDRGFLVSTLHGGKLQTQRDTILTGFRQGQFDVLVATDVAGRGIDIPDLKTVVNFDMPTSIEAYTHRIGRTGRMGRKGKAISFLTEKDDAIINDLRKFLERHGAIIPTEIKEQ